MISVPVPAAAISDRRLRRASAPCTKRLATLQPLTPQYSLPVHRQRDAPLLNEARIAESDADCLRESGHEAGRSAESRTITEMAGQMLTASGFFTFFNITEL